MQHELRGADILWGALKRGGVTRVFSLSGNHIMEVYDAAFGGDIGIVHVRHEAAALHMAEAWARLTGEVGVALVTGGQGHTNACAALPTAMAGEAPVLLLSGGIDPVTPPRHGERMLAALGPLARHAVVPNAGHGVLALPCIREAVAHFMTAVDPSRALAVDADCARELPRPPVWAPPGVWGGAPAGSR